MDKYNKIFMTFNYYYYKISYSLFSRQTARWCPMLFPLPFFLHALVLVISGLLFCSCVIGFLSCFYLYDQSICTILLNPLYLTLDESQAWDWLWSQRRSRGTHGAELSFEISALAGI